MAVEQITILTPEDARNLGQDYFEVVLQNWGGDPADRYPPVTSILTPSDQPPFPISPSAILIGPRSTVDRCWFSWNTGKEWPAAGFGFQFAKLLYRQLSVDTPMYFSQSAKQASPLAGGGDPIAEAMRRGLLYVFPEIVFPGVTQTWSTVLPADYLKADGATQPFGESVGSSEFFIAPTLHLQFVLKRSIPMPPAKRFPYQLIKDGLDAGNTGEEHCIFQLPTFGRKSITVGASSSRADTMFRVAALRGLGQVSALQETTEGQKTAGAIDDSVRFRFCNIDADYLILYATPALAEATTVRFSIAAYD